MDDINASVIEEFRANGGEVDQAMGGFFKGKPLLILHNTGARTGMLRTNPLVYATGATSLPPPKVEPNIIRTGSSMSEPSPR